MDASELSTYLASRKAFIEGALDRCLPHADAEPASIHEAMRYAVFSGGKRLRPILALAVCDLAGAELERVLPAACGIELLHTASLVFDDLPSMDNAHYRRERECTHIRFGEATAILAGLGLVAQAFAQVAQSGGDAEARNHSCLELAEAMGTQGVIGGQYTDLSLQDRLASMQQLESVFARKAAALFMSSVRIPAYLLGMKTQALKALSEYTHALGLAFQITDDILDAFKPGEDAGKKTHAAYLGADGARERAAELIQQAIDALFPLGEQAGIFRAIAEHVRTRTV